jgi:hypothetical protein
MEGKLNIVLCGNSSRHHSCTHGLEKNEYKLKDNGY